MNCRLGGNVGIYEQYILPKMTDFVCSVKPVTYQRKKVVPLAKGRVLEIGIGYRDNVHPWMETGEL